MQGIKEDAEIPVIWSSNLKYTHLPEAGTVEQNLMC